MNAALLQRLAAGACGLMALLVVLFQYVFTPESRAPTFLFALFTFLWLFGLAMLLVAPTFGAVGTTLWGLIAAAGAYRSHLVMSVENVLLIAGSLATAALAAAFLVARRRAGGQAGGRPR